jgi:putative transposase
MIEADLYAYLKDRIVTTEGAFFHGIGGIEDHLHIGVSVAPKIHLDEWLGQLKGSSSHEFGSAISWQRGYGVVSFGTKDLRWVLSYIQDQKQRHRDRDIYERLERIGQE